MISCSRQYLRKEMVKFDRVFGFTLFMLNQIIYDGDIIHCSISLISKLSLSNHNSQQTPSLFYYFYKLFVLDEFQDWAGAWNALTMK